MLVKHTLLAAMLLALFGFAFNAAFAEDVKPVRIAGKISKIEGKTLTITDAGKDTIVTCNDATKIHRDADPPATASSFADLKIDMAVRAYCTPGDNVAKNVFIFK